MIELIGIVVLIILAFVAMGYIDILIEKFKDRFFP